MSTSGERLGGVGEEEEEEESEFYSLLNVDRSASQEQIRSAYRRLCRIYHPDRHRSPEQQQAATLFFRRVQEAYQVLSNPTSRAVYDRGGRRGLENDMAVAERANLPSELLEHYEKLRTLWEERTYIQDANPQGSFQMAVDASSVLDRGEAAVSVQKITMEQSVDAKLSPSAFAKVAGSVSSTGRSLFGGLQLSLRQLLSNQNWVQLSTLIGSQPALGLDSYHQLSDRMYLTSQSMLSLSPYGLMLSANATATRRLSDSTSASLSIKNTGHSVSAQVVHHVTSATDFVSEVQVGYSSSHLKGFLHYHPEGQYSLRAGLKAGTRGLSAFYGADQEVATLTRVGGSVIVGVEEGVVLKLRLIRTSMAFQIRLQISNSFSLAAMLYATLVPLALYSCCRVFAITPLLRRQRLKEIEDKRADKARELAEKKREAEAAIELMKETVERVLANETGRQGLIIVEAWYGRLFDSEAGQEGVASCKVIDVHVPLQCLVVDSKLILHESSKASIPGFYDPCAGEKKYLRVCYEFRGTPHEVTIENSEHLVIPRRSHRITNLVD